MVDFKVIEICVFCLFCIIYGLFIGVMDNRMCIYGDVFKYKYLYIYIIVSIIEI